MKKLIGILTLAIISITANATQVDFSGSFYFGSGSISAGDAFSGQFVFNSQNPDFSHGGTSSLDFDYFNNARNYSAYFTKSIRSLSKFR